MSASESPLRRSSAPSKATSRGAAAPTERIAAPIHGPGDLEPQPTTGWKRGSTLIG